MAHVLIAGCGYLGSALGVRLAAAGHVVWGLRRAPAQLPTAIRGMEADVRVPNTLRHLPRVDHVFYLVGPDNSEEETLRAARVDGLRYLVGALAAAKQRRIRLFVASALDVYGDRAGEWVDEDSEVDATSREARWLHEGEKLAAEAPFPTTVLRLGTVYGPGRLGVLEPVLAGRPVPIARPAEHVNLIHRDDAAGALAHLIGLKTPAKLYLLLDREPVARLEVVQWLANRLGRPMPALDASVAPAPTADVRGLSERIVEDGYHFRYPTFRQGYEPLVSRLAGR